MNQPSTLVTAEQIGSLRDNKEASRILENLVERAYSELSIAIGEVGRRSGSKDSLDALADAHMVQNILDRLQDTVKRKNTKPISREAVGWALSKVEGDNNFASSVRAMLALENTKYTLSDDLKERLQRDFEKEALAEQARGEGVVAS